jgi:hypothetical protein
VIERPRRPITDEIPAERAGVLVGAAAGADPAPGALDGFEGMTRDDETAARGPTGAAPG